MHSKRPRAGFTLVELLVVIGIIAVLIGILLPALNKARRAANTVKCAANLRSIVQAMQLYADAYNNYIPGGAATSGLYLLSLPATGYTYGTNACPGLVNVWDWETPIAAMMGYKFPTAIDQGQTTPLRAQRYALMANYKPFICPDNIGATAQADVTAFGGLQAPSYVTATIFLYHSYNDKCPGTYSTSGYLNNLYNCPSYYTPAQGYSPKVAKVGAPQDKIYIADGSAVRFTSSVAYYPEFFSAYNTKGGGSYSDQGAFDAYSYSWNRGRAPGNTGTTGIDARIFSYRHGDLRQFSAGNSFRFNAAFYDGHVATMGDLEGSNPKFWMPRGSTVSSPATEMSADTYKQFVTAGATTYTAP